MDTKSTFVTINFQTLISDNIEHQLRYQDIEFVISYRAFERSGFCNQPLFTDELVLVAAQHHPRISPHMSDEKYLNEQHAVVMNGGYYSFSLPYYDAPAGKPLIGYQGTDLNSVMNIVSRTHMVALVPRWLAKTHAGTLNLNIIPLPWMNNQLPCYLTWHESASKDKGNMWMKSLLEQAETL